MGWAARLGVGKYEGDAWKDLRGTVNRPAKERFISKARKGRLSNGARKRFVEAARG